MINSVLHGDCLELMKNIPDGSVDMILCDLPYQVTACKWDTIIPFEPMWEQYNRIIKKSGVIALFGSEPFSSSLRSSNLKKYKYDLYWLKNRPTGMAYARFQPMRKIENVCIFFEGKSIYNPIKTKRTESELKKLSKKSVKTKKTENYNMDYGKTANRYDNEYKNPTNVLEFKCVANQGKEKLPHPTQKPVALFEYLIKTYTNEGETVLDNCAGSGTTAIACMNTNRNYILMEQEKEYIDIISKRIAEHNNPPS